MRNMFWSVLALCIVTGSILLPADPAYALCNPGTPHCVKAKLNNPGTLGSGDIYCKNSSLCGIDTGDGTSPGVLAARRR